MKIDLPNLAQEYCNKNDNHYKFTYNVSSKESVFYLYFE